MNQNISLPNPSSASGLQTALQSIIGIGEITVAPGIASSSCGCSFGTGELYAVSFESFVGDAPLIKMSQGVVVELQRGTPPTVIGVDEYSMILQDPLFTSTSNPIYFRFASVDAVGTSAYSPLSTVVPFNGAPAALAPIQVTPVSASELLVTWSSTVIRNGTFGTFEIQWDTNAAFFSYCTASPCSATTIGVLGKSLVPYSSANPASQFTITALTAGTAYFVRVRQCLGLSTGSSICSPFSYNTYPLTPLPALAVSAPSAVLGATATPVTPASLSVSWSSPEILPEGSNGLAVDTYSVLLSASVNQVQQLNIAFSTSLQVPFSLAVGTSSTRCLSVNFTTSELQLKLEELPSVDNVEISMSSSSVYMLTFSGYIKSGGQLIPPLQLGSNPSCYFNSSLPSSPVVQSVVTTSGLQRYVPPVVSFSTSSSGSVSGHFDLRFGFKGLMVKILGTPSGGPPVLCSIIAGQSVLSATSSVAHLLTSGVRVRINDQEHIVSYVVNGTVVAFEPYAVHSASSAIIMISDTLLGAALVSNGSSSFAMASYINGEVGVGDLLELRYTDSVSSELYDRMLVTVVAITGNLVSVTPPVLLFTASTANVAVYRQQNKLLSSDADPETVETKLTELALVRSVEVSRLGPSASNSYLWTATFTALTSLASPLEVSSTSSTAMNVSSCTDPNLNGMYISDSYAAGRRSYTLLNGPFHLSFAEAANLWQLYALNLTVAPIASETIVSMATSPAAASNYSLGCVVSSSSNTVVRTLLDMSSSVVTSVLQSPIAPDTSQVIRSLEQSNYTLEVQSVTLTSTDGLLFGGYELDFNNSLLHVAFRADESASDMTTKLESLSTVGIVNVSRDLIVNTVSGAFIGYKWWITFLSNIGNLPLLTTDLVPTVGAPLAGNNVSLVVAEEAAGMSLATETLLQNLTLGSQYTAQVVASNSLGGIGVSSFAGQNEGLGVAPLSFDIIDPPAAPVISALTTRSSSQLELQFIPPDSGGAKSIDRYLVEYTTDANFGFESNLTFRLYNTVGNDSYGFWRMQWAGGDKKTYFLPWGASAEEVQVAVENVGGSISVIVVRSDYFAGFGRGYEYALQIENDDGELSTASSFTVDISQLKSVGFVNNFQFSLVSETEAFVPSNYRYQWLYNTCGRTTIGAASDHQVLSIVSAIPDLYGTGSFRLSYGAELTSCIAYNASLDSIRSTFMALENINYVYLEETKRVANLVAYRDIHIFIQGVVVAKEFWPSLRLVPYDDGQVWGLNYGSSNCVANSLPTTSVRVLPVDDYIACSEGSPEVQVVVAEAEYSLSGYFYLYFNGVKTTALSVDSLAADVRSALNAIITTLTGEEISVTRYIHVDLPFRGYAWAVTFPASLGNVGFLVADDQYVGGVRAAAAVFPLVNVTISSDLTDISGHFAIALEDETTAPISWDATDGLVLERVQNLTRVGRAAMIGYQDQETPQGLTFSTLFSSGSTASVFISSNVSTRIAVGDSVIFDGYNDTVSGRYISSINLVNSSSSLLSLSENITILLPGAVTLHVGQRKFSKAALPGLFSLPILSTNGSTLLGNLTLYITAPLSGYLAANDTIWIGLYQLTVLVTPAAGDVTLLCLGQVDNAFEGAVGFYWSKGFERSIVIKAAAVGVRSARALMMSDLRGTNLVVTTDHTDGVEPSSVLLGSLFAVQTVSFRPDSLAASIALAAAPSSQYQLALGSEITTATNLSYGSSGDIWEAALESLSNVDRVSVTRLGDGISAQYAFGYIYTIKFWGVYGTRGPFPQLTVMSNNLAGINVYQDTVQPGEIMSHYSDRYSALNESTLYYVRLSAFNTRGMSKPSNIVAASTALFAGLPGVPQSVVLGQYKTSTSLSLSYLPPIHDGGAPITGYLVELDTTLAFSPADSSYSSMFYESIPEIQRITTSFSAGDNVKLRGGTFTVGFGGLITSPLSFNIAAYDLQVALNTLLGTRSVAYDPVVVSRAAYNRGYRWFVTFQGIPGNVGLLSVDASMLTGDNPQMSSITMVEGMADIVPGSYTEEVQIISTSALSPVNGSFQLSMEGYMTDAIQYNETAESFQQKLEALPTIYTVKVTRTPLSAVFQLFSWTVTFTNMRRDVVQGAGSLPPLTVVSSTLLPSASAEISVFEAVKGTSPMVITLSNLQPGVTVNVRVTAYNLKGFSPHSYVASAMPVNQPPPPQQVTLSIASSSSLNVTWLVLPGFGYFLDGFSIETYTSPPVNEVQVITTSAAGSLVEIQRLIIDADVNNLGGYFRLGFGGLVTRNIRWNANADGQGSVALELTRLSTVGPVAVSRTLSRRLLQSFRASMLQGSNTLSVASGSISGVFTGDTLWISDQIFTVISANPFSIQFSSTLITASLISAPVYKWRYCINAFH